MNAPSTAAPHEALAAFLGHWHAEGTTYGGDEQSPDNPYAGASEWRSIHSARWYAGERFVVMDEHANGPFDTLFVLGWDVDDARYFCRTVSNLGFARDYTMTVDMTVDGDVWQVVGEQERATVTFSDERSQEIHWEWRPGGEWLPLCDRTAYRID